MANQDDELNLQEQKFKIVEEDQSEAKTKLIHSIVETALEMKLQEIEEQIVKDIIVQKIQQGATDEKLAVSNELSVEIKVDEEGKEYIYLYNITNYQCDDLQLSDGWYEKVYERDVDEETDDEFADSISVDVFEEVLHTIVGEEEDGFSRDIDLTEVLELLKTDMSFRVPNAKGPVYPVLTLWKTIGNCVPNNGVMAELKVGDEMQFQNIKITDLNDNCLVLNSINSALYDEDEYKIMR